MNTYVCMHTCICVCMFPSLSFTPSFLFSFLSKSSVCFCSPDFYFYFLTRLYIHMVQNSKGLKEDSVKSPHPVLQLPNSFPYRQPMLTVSCESSWNILFTRFFLQMIIFYTILLCDSCFYH